MLQGCKWEMWDFNPHLCDSRVCALECFVPTFYLYSASVHSVGYCSGIGDTKGNRHNPHIASIHMYF